MHRQGHKRQRNTTATAGNRSRTLKVYLSTEDRLGLQRIAREMQISDSYAATLAIQQFRANAEAEKRDRKPADAPLLTLRHSDLPKPDRSTSR